MTSPQALRNQLLDMLEELDDRLEQITDSNQPTVHQPPGDPAPSETVSTRDSIPNQARD